MKYRGENLVENSVNKGCRGWDLEDMGGDSLKRPLCLWAACKYANGGD
jgi:hypothetical protein